MKAVWTIARRELRELLDHPMGYILLVLFLLANNFFFFRRAYLEAVASLRSMLDLLPWLLLLFVPAVTMRALSEDQRTGTIEVVLAHPVTELELLAGKYLGQLLFLWLALALTLPVPLALSLGADLQTGIVVAQYVGAGLLVAGLTGVGLWASSITPNQITAFIVAVAVMIVLILLGANSLIAGLPPALSNVAASLSVLTHFENITRGVIDLRDAVYFVTLAAMFLALAYLALAGRKLSPARATLRRLRLGTLLLAATLVIVNLFGRHIAGRLDLTPGNTYTLSPATKGMLRQVDDLVTIKLFISKDLPPEVAIVRRDLDDLLRDMQAAAGDNLRVQTLRPESGTQAESEARGLGIPPIQFNVIGESEFKVKEGYLGLAVQYADRAETIPVVDRTDDLEYRLVSQIRSLTRTDTTVVALVESGGDPSAGETYRALREELERSYKVVAVRPADSATLPDLARVLILAGSPMFAPDSFVARVRSFFERGGAGLVLASGMALQPQAPFAQPRPVPWNAALQGYGVSIRPDLVYDLASNERVTVPAQRGPFRVVVNYPLWIRAMSTQRSPVNQDIESTLLPWTSSIDTSGAAPGSVVPLLTTSRAGGVETGQAFVAPQRDFPGDSLATRLLGVLVNPRGDGAADSARGRLVVIGNQTFLTDQFVRNAPGGLALVLNAVDWLAQDEALMTIRAKDRSPPPLVFSSEFKRDVAKYGNLAGVPLLLIAFAGLRLWLRRRRTLERYHSPGMPAGLAA